MWTHWALKTKMQRRCSSTEAKWKRQHPGKETKKPQGKKGHTDFIDVNEYDSQYNEIDIHFINVDPDLSFTDDPDEIKVDDVAKHRKTEAYTIVHLPTNCEGKTNASVCVKVDTGLVEMSCH